MKIKEIYPDVITEDTSYEYKAVLNVEYISFLKEHSC